MDGVARLIICMLNSDNFELTDFFFKQMLKLQWFGDCLKSWFYRVLIGNEYTFGGMCT